MDSSFVHYAHTSLRCPSSSHHIFLPHASSLLHLSLFSLLYSSVFLSSLSSTHKRKPQGSLSMERKSLGIFFFLLLILLASQEMVVPSEARVCESQSHKFEGACVGDHNCALVCRNEGFSGGKCKGFRRRCFCTKLC